MKKIFSILFVMLLTITLAACGDGYTEVEMTNEELMGLISNAQVVNPENVQTQRLTFAAKGEFNVSEAVAGQAMGIKFDVDLNTAVTLGETLEDFKALFELNKLDLDVNAGAQSGTINGKGKLFHPGNGKLYADLDVAVDTPDLDATFKGKYATDEVLITPEQYTELIEAFNNPLDFNPGDLPIELPTFELDALIGDFIKVGKRGDDYKVTFSVNKEEILDVMLSAFIGVEVTPGQNPEADAMIKEIKDSFREMIKTFNIKAELEIKDNQFASFTVSAKVDLDMADLGVSVKISKFEIRVDYTNSPVNVPTDLETYNRSFEDLMGMLG